jgi:glycosidase
VLLKYSFRVRLARGTRWYGDDDSGTDIRKGGTGKTTSLRGDGFQLTAYAPGFTTPSWLQGAVVYEIFADRFRNGERSNDYCRAGSTSGCPSFYGDIQATLHSTWNEPLEDARATGVFNRDFSGGDLEGVEQKLDYLKGLGVDAIWLTPIFEARSNHRYDTADYMHVDPALGGDAAFASLAAAARSRGIHLILDGVFNHTSSDSRYFDRYHRYPETGACESPSSPYRDWYSITGSDVPCTSYNAFAGLDSLPKLNHANASLRDFIYRGTDSVVRHWATRGADGWRLDVAHEIPHDWWRDFRTVVKGYAPDAPLVGEITAGPEDATPWLVGNELDGVMNYRFRSAVDGYARLTNYSRFERRPHRAAAEPGRPRPARNPGGLPARSHGVLFFVDRLARYEPGALRFDGAGRRHRRCLGARAAGGAEPAHVGRSSDDLLRRRGRDQRTR